MLSFQTLSTVLCLSSTVFATGCYFPDGGVAGADTACNPNALVSACCFDRQACTSDGLCVSDPHEPAKSRIHRGTCTDKAWKSGNCPRSCMGVKNNGAPVYSCNSSSVDSYCCLDNCQCNDKFEVFSFDHSPADVYTVTIIGEMFRPTHTSTTSNSASTASATSANATATASATASTAGVTDSEPKSLNSTALGIGLGVGIPSFAAILVGAFFLWRHKKRATTPSDGTMESPSELDDVQLVPPQTKYAHHTEAEVLSYVPMGELSATQQNLVELPAGESPTLNAPAPVELKG
ncbi:uncharacterized protein K460DRAFT_346109 [Cucurbitaria berberidis CBS 394.84]|uniref:Mid2 domain-containing protein n=1 Tax=Cucurbitaria berberidis CBS 394.84 TaxID=1168544 RepID=A0A9P4L585_9PLEO|nr:uncharacterized protein K460DRAFT_346109 [Cucurbitaria berberidis CBS 394.84]KAF1842360.1 hypothetical protein K460DRAFT_346109 [Cucurbitaria berberidis CBS 394.84]